MPVHKMHTPLERLKYDYGLLHSWRKVALLGHYTKPDGKQIHYRTLYRWAVEGIEPKNAIERCTLGLPALIPAPACRVCGEVHTTKRCTRRKLTDYEMLSDLAEMGMM